MKILVISSSLNPNSRSKILAKFAFEHFSSKSIDVDFIDLRAHNLPFCDGNTTYELNELKPKIEAADGIVVATPIYNYSISGALKNFIELTNEVWSKKIVGFLCSAGGQRSYMSVLSLANSLMLDFRCVVMPDFVFANPSDFTNQGELTLDIQQRIQELASKVTLFAWANTTSN